MEVRLALSIRREKRRHRPSSHHPSDRLVRYMHLVHHPTDARPASSIGPKKCGRRPSSQINPGDVEPRPLSHGRAPSVLHQARKTQTSCIIPQSLIDRSLIGRYMHLVAPALRSIRAIHHLVHGPTDEHTQHCQSGKKNADVVHRPTTTQIDSGDVEPRPLSHGHTPSIVHLARKTRTLSIVPLPLRMIGQYMHLFHHPTDARPALSIW